MTAVSECWPKTAFGLDDVLTRHLRWNEQGFAFEIQSSDSELLEMARRIFVVQSFEADSKAGRRWRIERVNDSGLEKWLVSGVSESSSMIPVAAATRDMALLQVEHDSLDWLLHNTAAIVVHAALLTRAGRGVMVVGPSFAGKSTLATALWRNGWALMSDDLVFIDAQHRIASPAPRRVSLRFESRRLVGDPLWSAIADTPSCVKTEKGLFFHPHEVSDSLKPAQTPLSAIFFLARREAAAGPAEVCVINPAKASLSLVPYAFNVRTQPFVEGLRRVRPLLEHVPAFDLGRGELHAMVEAVEANAG